MQRILLSGKEGATKLCRELGTLSLGSIDAKLIEAYLKSKERTIDWSNEIRQIEEDRERLSAVESELLDSWWL